MDGDGCRFQLQGEKCYFLEIQMQFANSWELALCQILNPCPVSKCQLIVFLSDSHLIAS